VAKFFEKIIIRLPNDENMIFNYKDNRIRKTNSTIIREIDILRNNEGNLCSETSRVSFEKLLLDCQMMKI
jgi:hypothetical protein